MDTEGIVTGLVGASSGQLNALKTRANETDSAVSTLSSVSTLLATLQKSVDALANARDIGSYTASSSSAAIAVSANGTALPGAYNIKVNALAQEQRNYSSPFATMNEALGQTGTLSLQVGTGTAVNVDVTATDTLDGIAAKINASGARLSASIFNDGTSYRLQVRGLDTGAANTLTFGGTGLSLGLNNLAASKVQSAQDAAIEVDGFVVKRASNQVAGAIQGVTLALTEVTTAPVTVRVQGDPAGLQTKVQSVVDSYNAVINKIHTSAGYGTNKGSTPALQGDSSLRSITERLSGAMLTRVGTTGNYQTLGTIGLSTNRDGTLKLDSAKLSTALQNDAAGVAALLAGPSSGKGVMDVVSDLAKNMTSSKGTIQLRSDSLASRAKTLRGRADAEQTRLNRYAETLRKAFTAMDTTVAGNNAQMNYINQMYR
jgi:flagellar hook-associated protein 2